MKVSGHSPERQDEKNMQESRHAARKEGNILWSVGLGPGVPPKGSIDIFFLLYALVSSLFSFLFLASFCIRFVCLPVDPFVYAQLTVRRPSQRVCMQG